MAQSSCPEPSASGVTASPGSSNNQPPSGNEPAPCDDLASSSQPASAQPDAQFRPLAHSACLGIIGVQHRNSPEDWGVCVVRVIQQEFARAGGRTLFLNRFTGPDQPYIKPGYAVSSMRGRGADCLAFVGLRAHPAEWSEFASAAARIGGPLVVISWDEVLLPVPHVFYDNVAAGMAAARHLLEQGCRRLAFLAPFTEQWVELRIRGARQAVEQSRFPDATIHVYPADYRSLDIVYPSPATAVAAWELLSRSDGPSASGAGPLGILAAQDMIGFQVLNAARSLGKVPGRDFILIGFDDAPGAREAGLSSLRPPLEAMGREAVNMLIQQFQGERSRMQTCLASEIIERASSRLVR